MVSGGRGSDVTAGFSPEAKRAYELAYEYEGKYGACSQCTLLAIMDALGERTPDVFKASFGFAGGIGSLSKSCGALSAGILAISLSCGRDLEHLTTQTEDEKRGCMQKVRGLYGRFMEEYGSVQCEDIHRKIFGRTFNQWDKQEFEEFLRLGGHVDKCTHVAAKAAMWAVQLLGQKA